ncbi:Gfo/Idh/MocA family protein [Bauldia sp.]|uniref:Gfo/Idh/MocA family protein n=1 Tax=Bauldia sp. TaxID=2575872 RepID=UPI003BAAEBDB
MSEPLRVAVVGAGVGVNHIEAYNSLPDLFAVDVLCDIDAAKAGTIAAEHGISQTTSRFDDLLAGDLDIIDICTPPSLHFDQAKQALLAGKHVVVEKPFTRSLAEADELAAVERESGRRCCPIFQYRFGNGISQLLHLRDRGLAGQAYVATVETHWRRTAAYYDNPWRGRWATELGGSLVAHAIHSHDILTYVLGPAKTVFARAATRVNPIETEDCAAIALEMEDGSLVTLSVTLGAEEDMSRLRFCFAGLTAESNRSPYNPGTTPWTFTAADPARQTEVDAAVAEVPVLPERNAGQFLRLHTALTDGGPLPVSIADARASLELATAAYYSARTDAVVTLPLDRDHPLYEGWLPETAKEEA